MICDAHVHFFSPGFFGALAAQRQVAVADALRHLGWEDPESVEALADRWVAELDRHGVSRAAVIASVPGDEDSVVAAVTRHPTRLVGYFMVDPTRDDAESRVLAGLSRGAVGVCLFPAMHRYALTDERVARVCQVAAGFAGRQVAPPGRREGAVLFVHCGVLSVGVRKKLGLPSAFDMRFGNPLDLHALALRHPTLPIVIPHFGAGLFREALMLADVCPNVYLDTSSSNAWIRYTPGLTLEQVFATALDVVGASRLLFGTDSSFFPRGWVRDVYERQQAALEAIGAGHKLAAEIAAGQLPLTADDETFDAKVKVLKEERAAKKGESFSVRLESTPGTGYSWRVLGPEYGPLELKKASFEKGGDKPGAPGVQVFEFTAKTGNQQVVLVFNYGRPFEGIGTSTYELRVKVAE